MRLDDPRRETAAWSFARSGSQAEAARTANVARSTTKRWVKDPAFLARVDEIKALLEGDDGDDLSAEATKGLARLIPIAEAVVEAALKGEPYNGRPVSPQQHSNALKTIELARKLEPRASTDDKAPTLGDLIAAADATRSAG